jgi:hypothetical protein
MCLYACLSPDIPFHFFFGKIGSEETRHQSIYKSQVIE